MQSRPSCWTRDSIFLGAALGLCRVHACATLSQKLTATPDGQTGVNASLLFSRIWDVVWENKGLDQSVWSFVKFKFHIIKGKKCFSCIYLYSCTPTFHLSLRNVLSFYMTVWHSEHASSSCSKWATDPMGRLVKTHVGVSVHVCASTPLPNCRHGHGHAHMVLTETHCTQLSRTCTSVWAWNPIAKIWLPCRCWRLNFFWFIVAKAFSLKGILTRSVHIPALQVPIVGPAYKIFNTC